MELNTVKIGQFIYEGRKQQNMTQAELGERLGVSPQSVSNWERGETLPETSLLPDLAEILRCSVDALLMGGAGCTGYRRIVTVAQMREAVESIGQIGALLGRDHFIYRTIVDALNQRMNTDIEPAFIEPRLMEVFTVECLLACVQSGDYVDPRDAAEHLRPSRARDALLDALRNAGIR